MKENAYIKITRGEKTSLMPLEDYLDYKAYQYMDFDSYEELFAAGYSIDIPTLYNKDSVQMDESTVAQIMKELGIKSHTEPAQETLEER